MWYSTIMKWAFMVVHLHRSSAKLLNVVSNKSRNEWCHSMFLRRLCFPFDIVVPLECSSLCDTYSESDNRFRMYLLLYWNFIVARDHYGCLSHRLPLSTLFVRFIFYAGDEHERDCVWCTRVTEIELCVRIVCVCVFEIHTTLLSFLFWTLAGSWHWFKFKK